MHLVAGSDVFATKPFARGCIVGYYYGSLMNEDLYQSQHTTKTYREQIMAVTPDTFEKWANQLPETTIDQNQVEHAVWIVAAPFCTMKYISEGRYLVGDCASKCERLLAILENKWSCIRRNLWIDHLILSRTLFLQ